MSLLFITLVALLLSVFHGGHAHSTTPRPLKKIGSPSLITLEILPRPSHGPLLSNLNNIPPIPPQSLRFDDSLRLAFVAFDETFYLHLRPNDHLVHSAARINYYKRLPNGQEILSHSEPLLRYKVNAFNGEVIAAYHSPTRMLEDAARVYPRPHSAVLGWARIMIHSQGDSDRGVSPIFEGAFSVNGIIHHVMSKGNYLRNKHELDPVLPPDSSVHSDLVIWRDSDEMSAEEEYFSKTQIHPTEPIVSPQSCGHDRLDYNIARNPVISTATCGLSWIEGLLKPSEKSALYRRDDAPSGSGGMGTDFRSSIGSVQGCPTTQKVIYMGVAADCTYVSNYGSKENATTQILTTWNTASALYKTTFNVSLGISEIQIRDPSCPTVADPNFAWNTVCTSADLDTRLSLFSQWRGNKGDDGAGLWHLMSGCPTGSEVGIAWLGTLCQTTASGKSPTIVSGAAVSTSGRTEWQVVAHEIGHNFGAIHDCSSACSSNPPCCPLSTDVCSSDGRFIMNPVSQSSEKIFSPCSIGNICSLMGGVSGRVNTTCLLEPDPSRKSISLQMCGNGIVEAGEDCDPGSGVASQCCDTQTCKFKSGASCDPGSSPCCTQTCNFAPSTQVCRPTRDSNCDKAEFCTGNSSTCPTDIMAPNGQSCGTNKLACASGICTSVSQQCRSVGASLNLSQACPDQSDTSCQISCQDPRTPNSCVQLTSLLIDGSPCGFGGSCIGGRCQTAGALDTAKAWYTSNLQISIPITIIVSLLVLAGLFTLGRRICGRKRRPSVVVTTQSRVGRAGLVTRPHPSVATQPVRGPGGSNSHWVDPVGYNGPYRS